jgi:probable rRNA maturation factor
MVTTMATKAVRKTAKKAAKKVAKKTGKKKAVAKRAPVKASVKPRVKATSRDSVQLDVQAAVARAGVPSTRKLQLWAQAAYEVHHAAHTHGRKRAVQPVQVSLRIVAAAESRKLNRQWRDEDHATNVLSFPAGEMPELEGELPTLGDLVICAPLVKREALQQGKKLDAHWAHLMIHGVLHLLGYDHENERDAALMEACEVAIVESLGFANPYAV